MHMYPSQTQPSGAPVDTPQQQQQSGILRQPSALTHHLQHPQQYQDNQMAMSSVASVPGMLGTNGNVQFRQVSQSTRTTVPGPHYSALHASDPNGDRSILSGTPSRQQAMPQPWLSQGWAGHPPQQSRLHDSTMYGHASQAAPVGLPLAPIMSAGVSMASTQNQAFQADLDVDDGLAGGGGHTVPSMDPEALLKDLMQRKCLQSLTATEFGMEQLHGLVNFSQQLTMLRQSEKHQLCRMLLIPCLPETCFSVFRMSLMKGSKHRRLHVRYNLFGIELDSDTWRKITGCGKKMTANIMADFRAGAFLSKSRAGGRRSSLLGGRGDTSGAAGKYSRKTGPAQKTVETAAAYPAE